MIQQFLYSPISPSPQNQTSYAKAATQVTSSKLTPVTARISIYLPVWYPVRKGGVLGAHPVHKGFSAPRHLMLSGSSREVVYQAAWITAD